MSLFPSPFDNDPFFRGAGFPPSMFGRDPFEGMFGMPRQQAPLTDGRPAHTSGRRDGGQQQQQQQLMLRDPFQSMFPFGGGMSPFGSMFQNMERMMQQAASDPNAHTFSSSSVMHYSSGGGGGGQPRVYQASTSTRQAPGGVKETRKAVHDSDSGVRKMAIGHHIGDRSHVIEKHHNVRSREQEEHQQFVNLDEDEAGDFDQEWKQRTSTFNTRYHPSFLQDSRQRHEARGLPAPRGSDTQHPHTGEKRKRRPPSLVHDDSEGDIQYVRLDHPSSSSGASHSRSRATPYERREPPRVGETSSRQHLHRHHHQQQQYPQDRGEQTFSGVSSRHDHTAGVRDHTERRRQLAVNPEHEQFVGGRGGIPRGQPPREQGYGEKGTGRQRRTEEYQQDPSVRLGSRHDSKPSKRHQQGNVRFQ